METMRAQAARNNAEWCDAVCRTHGVRTRFDDDAWISETRTPPLYPDAVTLVPDASVPALLARIDDSEGCSVKDSFASIDLRAHGFDVLFEAQWMFRPASAALPDAPEPAWTRIGNREQLAAWEAAGRGSGIPAGVFRPALLDEPSIAVVALARDGHIRAGAVLNRSAGVTGISNFFGAAPASGTTTHWPGLLACSEACFPGSTFVGYETGAALAVARRFGFEPAGPLRVWIKDD